MNVCADCLYYIHGRCSNGASAQQGKLTKPTDTCERFTELAELRRRESRGKIFVMPSNDESKKTET
jgi:hypothetical protein